MLAALERSRLAQRQLVSDASHELRTPLTSAQANLDALAMGEGAAPARARSRSRRRAGPAARADRAGGRPGRPVQDRDRGDRGRGRAPGPGRRRGDRARAPARAAVPFFVLDAEPCLVRAAPARLDRAIANLLDNACKWNRRAGLRPPGGRATGGRPVEVRVRAGVLEVRDHGPGIAAEDLPRVFDRFYRCPGARGATRVGARAGDREADGRGSRRSCARRQRSRRRRQVDARASAARDDRRRARRL